MRLRTRFTLFSVGVVWVTTTVLVFALYVTYRESFEANLKVEHERLAMAWRTVCHEAVRSRDPGLMARYASLVGMTNDVEYVYFADPEGRILAHTHRLWNSRSVAEWERGRPRASERAMPVETGGRRAGSAVIGISESAVSRSRDQALVIPLYQVGILAGVLAAMNVLAIGLFADSLDRRFRRLERAAAEIEGGNFDVRLGPGGSSELDALTRAFNRMAERLAALDRLKDEFVSSVSHDLGSPLAAIWMYARFVTEQDRDRGKLLPRHRRFVRTIMENARRLELYVRNILDTAKLKAGRMEYFPRELPLDESARRARELLGILAEDKGIEWVSEIPKGLVAWADPERLEQALANVLSNAIKFTPRGGRVAVGGAAEGDRVAFWVEDTGPGVAAEDAALAFQPFRRLGAVGQRAQGIKGTGLGLSLVKRTIEDMGGSVSLESPPGRGARVTLSLPGVAARRAVKAARRPRAGPAGPGALRRKVLVADDDPSFARLAKQMLENAGCDVVLAQDGDEALRLARAEGADAALLDVSMPGLGGADVLRRLKADPGTASIRVVLCSIRPDGRQVEEARALGAADFLVKPLDPEQVRAAFGGWA